jgi:hypothetical protein
MPFGTFILTAGMPSWVFWIFTFSDFSARLIFQNILIVWFFNGSMPFEHFVMAACLFKFYKFYVYFIYQNFSDFFYFSIFLKGQDAFWNIFVKVGCLFQFSKFLHYFGFFNLKFFRIFLKSLIFITARCLLKLFSVAAGCPFCHLSEFSRFFRLFLFFTSFFEFF